MPDLSYWMSKCDELTAQLSEAVERAREYKSEWESACNRERGRIEDVKDLTARLKDTEERLRKEEQACADFISDGNVLRRQLEEAKKEIEEANKNKEFWENHYHCKVAELEEAKKEREHAYESIRLMNNELCELSSQNARLKEALVEVVVWLRDHRMSGHALNISLVVKLIQKCEQALQQLSNQGAMKIETDGFVGRRISENELSNQGDGK